MKTNIISFKGWCCFLAVLLATVITYPVMAQQANTSISGVVTSSTDGRPLAAVSISTNSSLRATSTDNNGTFSIDVTAQDRFITVNHVGYEAQQVNLGGKRTFQIILQSVNQDIETVVVTALGIKRSERSLGYSVGKVDGESLNTVVQENLLGGIAGKVPGVTLNQTGGVGSSISMVIRGATSLSSDNQPLYVIDGVPLVSGMNNVSNFGNDRNQVDYGNPISDINPDDVESISVLKGPSAAALYGSRAGNGVVLITTKSGRKGQKTTINFSTNNVFEQPVRFMDFHYKYASGTRPNGPLAENSAYWAGPELDKGILAIQWNSPVDANGNKIPTELKSYSDNMKNFLNTAITSSNNLSIAGAGEKFQYRFSVNNMNHKGLIPNSDLYRNGISSNVTYDIANSLKISTNLNFVRAKSNDMPATGNRGSNPLQAVYNFPHVNILDLKDYWMEGEEGIQQREVARGRDNPYFLAYALTNSFMRDRIYGNVKLDWEINNNISAFFRAAETRSVETRETKIPWSYSRDTKGGYHLQDIKNRENNVDFLFTYNSGEQFPDFTYSVSAGGNYMYQYNTDNYAGSRRNAGLTIPGLYRLSNIPAAGLDIRNGEYKKSIYSLYAMANLSYKRQLYLDLTARNDWSSTLPASNRSYFYPSASLSWIANETFSMPSQVSLLKFRGGMAQVGNDTNPYQLNPVLSTGRWGDLIYMEMPETLLSPNLKPEIATSYEAGIDLNMYGNRLRFEGTYYQVENKNQILPVSTAQSSGYARKLINAGRLQSKGWEFGIGGTPIKKDNSLTWDVNINFSRNRTRILELAPGIDYYEYWNENSSGAMTWVGEEVGNLYSRGYARVTDPQSPYYLWPVLGNDGKWIQDNAVENRMKVGNFNPKLLTGMQNTISYKNIHLSFSLDWRYGGQFQSQTYRYGGSDWKSQHQLNLMIQGGTMSSEELTALLKSDPGKYIIPHNGDFPRVGGLTQESGGFYINQGGVEGYDGVFIPGVIAQYDANGGLIGYKEHLGGEGTMLYPASSQFSWNYNQQVTFDADYLKLRELAIGYDVKGIKHVKNLRVSVFTRNIMLWTKAKIGIDPERAFQVDGGSFRQGIETQNLSPWTVPFGFKLDLTL
ncbi:SusC/RagA family TonB-linked outer membrane protein [Sphingobacterium wenxiniae]|uniref:TonB-linked outer membrane protein, SusC/RagA family n=1 Tax=Sphingobacterium wenxiniae TaxID=683125 RepID=A0A1I6V570_9SPHI|nr:SusC/RagA family TonB-linked outer membrane protein [Sphingobacterium wenxiniae]SFT08756.1 TonB-linked outer membrane protein, SusC/RagA family [Sphingobacterium wenxiniae]